MGELPIAQGERMCSLRVYGTWDLVLCLKKDGRSV